MSYLDDWDSGVSYPKDGSPCPCGCGRSRRDTHPHEFDKEKITSKNNEMKECNGKRTYASEREAKKVRNVREHDVSKLRVYQCDVCYGWHLTKQYKKDRMEYEV